MQPGFLRYFELLDNDDQAPDQSSITQMQDELELRQYLLPADQEKVWSAFCANTPEDQVDYFRGTKSLNHDLSNIPVELKTARFNNTLAAIALQKQEEDEWGLGKQCFPHSSNEKKVWDEFCDYKENTLADQIGHFNGTNPLSYDLSNISLELQRARYKTALMTLYHSSEPQQSVASLENQLYKVQHGRWPQSLSQADEALQQPQLHTQPAIMRNMYEERSINNAEVFPFIKESLLKLFPDSRPQQWNSVMAYEARRIGPWNEPLPELAQSSKETEAVGNESFIVTPCVDRQDGNGSYLPLRSNTTLLLSYDVAPDAWLAVSDAFTKKRYPP